MRRLTSVSVPPADPRQAPGPPQDLFPLVVGQLRKAAAALDAVGVVGQEAVDHRLR